MELILAVLVSACAAAAQEVGTPERPAPCVSGRYPHLAMFNRQGECGIGAVVPWADRLWVMTYAPHRPEGSDDKLYEISAGLRLVARRESVGGTPASRLIHRESGQLFLGPYAIDARGGVRVIPPSGMPGRLTAAARHLTDPASKIYVYDMEGLLYEVDVRGLGVQRLFVRALPGWHGKGAYAGQGRLILANNGEEPAGGMDRFKPFDYQVPFGTGGENAGALGEWDGRTWALVERRQFTEVTGPGGISGAPTADAPVWSLGWDRRSVMLKVLSAGQWRTYRLPKADYSYDGRHGWHTEWPRIREVLPGRFLANMHGGWFEMPGDFDGVRCARLIPLGSHLKITGDVAGWNGRLVFGCDDTALSTFGQGNSLAGQSQSNLWFASWEDLGKAGRTSGFGGPWVDDDVVAGESSLPYHFHGYRDRVLHLAHGEDQAVPFVVEIDRTGRGSWERLHRIVVPARGYAFHVFDRTTPGEWLRIRAEKQARKATAYLHYGPGGSTEDPVVAAALARPASGEAWWGGTLRTTGGDRGTLAFHARRVDADGRASAPEAWEVGADLTFQRLVAGTPDETVLVDATPAGPDVQADEASLILWEGKLRFRLPQAVAEDPLLRSPVGWSRCVREVVTERSLVNAGGTFFVLPRPNSGGVRRLKPVATHGCRITDFCSWRGLLALAGTLETADGGGHFFGAGRKGPTLWLGDVDDLWKMGKPRGRGGPWRRSPVLTGQPSDPYLMTGYDRKVLELRHEAGSEVVFTADVDVTGDGTWRRYAEWSVPPGQGLTHEFPAGYSAHWIRLTSSSDCRATAQFTYD